MKERKLGRRDVGAKRRWSPVNKVRFPGQTQDAALKKKATSLLHVV